MPSLTRGTIYYCSDDGTTGNISSFVLADNNGGKAGGWNGIYAVFAAANAAPIVQNRIYIAEGGQLRSYAPTDPFSDEVIVGADGWPASASWS